MASANQLIINSNNCFLEKCGLFIELVPKPVLFCRHHKSVAHHMIAKEFKDNTKNKFVFAVEKHVANTNLIAPLVF